MKLSLGTVRDVHLMLLDAIPLNIRWCWDAVSKTVSASRRLAVTKYMVKKDLVPERMYGSIRCTEEHLARGGKVISTLGRVVNEKVILVYEGLDYHKDMLIEMKRGR